MSFYRFTVLLKVLTFMLYGIYSSFAYPMVRVVNHCRYYHVSTNVKSGIRTYCMMKNKPIEKLIESISRRDGRHVPIDYFTDDVDAVEILKTIKNKLYETKELPHIDPTPGNSGYCQLISGFLENQISQLNKLDLDNSSEHDVEAVFPLVKAFILQEFYNPSNYQDLSPELVGQRLNELKLLKNNGNTLSKAKKKLLLKATQESFMEDLFHFSKTNESTSIIDSMERAMDIIHQSDCLIYLRYHDGTPSRPDIFSSAANRTGGELYRRTSKESEIWKKVSGAEQAQLILENNTQNIIQVHFECQLLIRDLSLHYGLRNKPAIKRIVDKKIEMGHVLGTDDLFGFGDDEFNLREFVMNGVRAINDPELEFCDPKHPVTVPCHFSVVAGIENLSHLMLFSVFFDVINQEYNVSKFQPSRRDFSNTPLQIQRYVSHCRNISPHNELTWVLDKQLNGVNVELGLAYDENSNVIDPFYSYFKLLEKVDNNWVRVKDSERILQTYLEFITKIVLPLTKKTYLYPQVRFLLNEAKINEETIHELSEPNFINSLMNKAQSRE